MRIGRLARWYRWVEYLAFGRALERCRFANLARLVKARRILILGEGDGRTLARMLQIAPRLAQGVRFDVFEISPEMIALARERTSQSDRIAFHLQDARRGDWKPGSYDAVVTNFFLDCLNEQDARQLIRQLANALDDTGIWLVGEFAIPRTSWRRWHAQIWIATMYRFFRIATGLTTRALPPIEDLLREAGLERIAQNKTRAGLIVSEVWHHATEPIPAPSAARQI